MSLENWSHEELRQAQLRVSDPYVQPGLLSRDERIPEGIRLLEIVNTYNVGPETEKIYCHVCGGHRHQKGLTGRLEGGTLALFGSRCGPKQFGLKNYHQAEREFEETVRLSDALKEVERITGIAPEIHKGLLGLREPARTMDKVNRRFSSFADFHQRIREAVRTGGGLYLYQQVRDRHAEERRAQQNEHSTDEKNLEPIFRTVPVNAHTIRGGAFLEISDFAGRIDSAISALHAIVELQGNTEGMSRKDIRSRISALSRATRRVQEAAELFEGMMLFFRRENLEGMAQWANASGGFRGRFAAAEGFLQRDHDWVDDRVEVRGPTSYPPLDLSFIKLFKGEDERVAA